MSMTKLMYLIQWDDPLFSCSFTTQKWLLFKNLMWWSKMDNIFRIYRVELTKITLSGPSIFRKRRICWSVLSVQHTIVRCNFFLLYIISASNLDIRKACSAPSTKASVSAASVDFTTLAIFVDRQTIGQELL